MCKYSEYYNEGSVILEGKCPVTGMTSTSTSKGMPNKKKYFPNNLDLSSLRENCEKNNPMSKDFNYEDEFNKLDYKELKDDLYKLMTDSKEWWPADYGNYGPFFIRMSWHSAGTYRVSDGRGVEEWVSKGFHLLVAGQIILI